MTSTFDKIKKYYNACRPDEPIDPDDYRWVDLAPVRGREGDIASQMLRVVEREEKFANVLVTGFTGTGKTSVLNSYRQQLERSGYHVIHTDAEVDYLLNAYEPVTINDILLILAMSIGDGGLGPSYVGRLWEDIKSLAGSEVLPDNLEVGVAGVTFKTVLNRVPTLHEHLRKLARERAQFDQVSELVREAQAKVRRDNKRGLVVIIDSLDHLRDPQEQPGTPVTDSILRVLRESSELRRLDVHLILTVPPTILPHAHDLRANFGEPLIVPEAGIFTKDDKRIDEAFVKMQEFVDRRVPLDSFDSIDSVHSLIAASGGYLRELLRLLRDCLLYVDDLPITSGTVKRIIQRAIAVSAELPIEDYRADIESILSSPDHRLPRTVENSQRLYQLIRDRVILSYRNDDNWEGVHPLVMAHVDREKFEQLVFPTAASVE